MDSSLFGYDIIQNFLDNNSNKVWPFDNGDPLNNI
jgi:hypothetical protein